MFYLKLTRRFCHLNIENFININSIFSQENTNPDLLKTR